MFADDFDTAKALATENCPRCSSLGLKVPDAETYARASEAGRFIEKMIVCPSIAAWCPSCGLVGNWPGMCWKPEVRPQRKKVSKKQVNIKAASQK